MKFSRREVVLALATLGAVLIGLTYYIGIGKVREWGALKTERADLEFEIERYEKKIARRDRMMQRLEELKLSLPQHPKNKDVKTVLLQQIQSLADTHGLVLRSLDPDKERILGQLDLYEQPINCAWQGHIENLTRFLFELQSQGAIMDIRQLVIKTERSRPGEIKGTFTVDCAYSRN